MTSKRVTWVTRVVVLSLTVIIFVLAMLPSGAGFLVPIASLGFGLGLQLVPSALGMLYFKSVTEAGAFLGLVLGVVVMALIAITQIDIPVGPGIAGIMVNIIVTVAVRKVPESSVKDFHDMFNEYMRDNAEQVVYSDEKKA